MQRLRLFVVRNDTDVGNSRFVVAPIEGQPFAVFTSPGIGATCVLSLVSLGADSGVATVIESMSEDIDVEHDIVGPLYADPSWSQQSAALRSDIFGGAAVWQDPSVSGRSIVTAGDGRVLRSDAITGMFAVIANASEFGVPLCCANARGVVTTFDTDGLPYSTWSVPGDGGAPAMLIQHSASESSTTMLDDSAGHFFWITTPILPDGGVSTGTLWRSPTAETADGIVATRVGGTTADREPYGATSGNRVAYERADGTVNLVNGDDGSYWTLTAPTGSAYRVGALGTNEIVLNIQQLGTSLPTAIVRQRIDALGPALPALP